MKMYKMMMKNFNSKKIYKKMIIKQEELRQNLKIYIKRLLKENKTNKLLKVRTEMRNALLCHEFIQTTIKNELKHTGQLKNYQAIYQLMILV